MAVRQTIKRRAMRASEVQHQNGLYGTWIDHAETLKRAAGILHREMNPEQPKRYPPIIPL